MRLPRGTRGNANGLWAVLLVFEEVDELPDIAGALWHNNAKLGEVAAQGIDESGAL